MKPTDIILGISAPCYNEQENICEFLNNCKTLNAKYHVQVVLVDDGSSDLTVEIIKDFMNKNSFMHLIQRVKTSSRSQVYTAYHEGLKWLYGNTDANIFAQIDSDNVCSLDDICQAIKVFEDDDSTEFVKLSKYLSSHQDEREFSRRLLSYIYTKICKILFDENVSDYSTGIRFYSKEIVYKLAFRKRRFSSPIGLLDDLFVLMNMGIKVKEVGFSMNKRKFGTSFLNFKELIPLIYEFFICIIINTSVRNRK